MKIIYNWKTILNSKSITNATSNMNVISRAQIFMKSFIVKYAYKISILYNKYAQKIYYIIFMHEKIWKFIFNFNFIK